MRRRFWTYAIGPKTACWAEARHDLVLGWWTVGDCRDYADPSAMARALAEGPCDEMAADEAAACCWRFAHEMGVGDVVIAVRGTDKVLGLGVVTGGYRHEVDRASALGHRRRVEWLATGMRRVGCVFRGGPLEELAEDDVRIGQCFSAYGKTLADADASRYTDRVWWLATNVAYWSLDDEVAVGETFFYYKYNERGHVRTSGRAFDEIQRGDLVLGYVGGSVKDRGVHSLLRCEAGLGSGDYEGAWRDNVVVFRKIRELSPFIPWEAFRDNPILAAAHMVRVKNVGSLFGFTPEQRDEILRILRLGKVR